MKKKLLYIAALIICMSIITGGTFAYFTYEETTHNVITSKKVNINVLSMKLEDGSLKDDGNTAIPIMPATTVNKVVMAQSLETPSWIRLKYELNVFDSNGDKMTIPKAELDNIIIIEPDNTDWIEKDGWWYYKSVVQSGEITTPLFDEIKFSGPGMGNEYQKASVKLLLKGQAVQSANNGSSVMEAAGWPTE